ELLMTKLAMTCDAQVIALSATIGNPEEIAKWANAELVVSDYRPVKLMKGVVHAEKAYYNHEEGIKEKDLLGSSKIPEIRLLEDTLEQNKQILIFYSTKRNAEAGAARLSLDIKKRLSREDIAELESISSQVLNVLDRPTEQCTKLAGLISNGVAFHHAGLLNQQRAIIESAFKANRIKAIC